MKKDFFSIMKNYDPERDIKINLSSDRIKEKTLKKISLQQTRKIHFSKKFAIIAAAAAVSITACSTALAYEFDVFDKAISFFENKNAVFDVNLDETDRNIISENLKENSISVESKGTTIQLTGSMYDENMAYFFFKLTAPEGTVLGNEIYDFKENTIVLDEHYHQGGAGWQLVFDDDNLTDNITYFTLQLGCNGVSVQDFKEINLSDLYIPHENPADEKVILEGQWTIPLETGEPTKAIELCKEPSMVRYEDKSAEISSLKLSPLCITFISSNELWIENPYKGDMNYTVIAGDQKADINIYLKMKDGSICSDINMNGGGNADGGEDYIFVYHFDKPIDIDNVESVVICDHEFKVE